MSSVIPRFPVPGSPLHRDRPRVVAHIDRASPRITHVTTPRRPRALVALFVASPIAPPPAIAARRRARNDTPPHTAVDARATVTARAHVVDRRATLVARTVVVVVEFVVANILKSRSIAQNPRSDVVETSREDVEG